MADPKQGARERREFWKAVEKSAAAIRDKPDWMKAGITLNPENFETFTAPQKGKRDG